MAARSEIFSDWLCFVRKRLAEISHFVYRTRITRCGTIQMKQLISISVLHLPTQATQTRDFALEAELYSHVYVDDPVSSSLRICFTTNRKVVITWRMFFV